MKNAIDLFFVGSGIGSGDSARSVRNSGLAGPVTDAGLVQRWIARFPQIAPFFVTAETGGPSKEFILEKLRVLFDGSKLRFIVVYSGHGDGEGNWLMKAKGHFNGIPDKSQLIAPRDALDLWRARFDKSEPRRLLLIVDACHSESWTELNDMDRLSRSKQVQNERNVPLMVYLGVLSFAMSAGRSKVLGVLPTSCGFFYFP